MPTLRGRFSRTQMGTIHMNMLEKTLVATAMNPEEWQARVDLAAVYRLIADHGWDDVIYIIAQCASRARSANS
jgi:hypothetical protein